MRHPGARAKLAHHNRQYRLHHHREKGRAEQSARWPDDLTFNWLMWRTDPAP